MKVTAAAGNPNIATVYRAEMDNGKYVEFIESVQPPIPREKKWVLIVSTLYGCPVGCSICDAGGWYDGKLSTGEILSQVDYLVAKYFPGRIIPVKKFKIQFARMGEPAFNPNVLEVLDILPSRYNAPGLLPCLSTVAPIGTEPFFEKLLAVKQRCYTAGKFQLQFSIHSTDSLQRDRLIPVKKWDFDTIAHYGTRFYTGGDRKITLNFALAVDSVISVKELIKYFDPGIFTIKLTPVNPTIRAVNKEILNGMKGDTPGDEPPVARKLRDKGYDVILSIGEAEENKIGSNCGQYISGFREGKDSTVEGSYQYPLKTIGK